MIGKILGDRYEIIEEIGKGGMAHVYKAKCTLLNRIVALKILRDDLDGGEDFLNRFKSEARAAASLTHSNIVAIFDVGVDNGINYIVMEYVDGITLKEYILQNESLAYEEVLDISYQICEALEAAHEKNIVHRDIKPHNILITEDKKIKVTDFGIARFGTGNTLTTDDDILGSVHYISPEQAKGDNVDNRSDIYSLGVAMYEMITGKVPFDADTPVAVAMMQIEDTPVIPAEFEYSVPIALWQIIFKALSKDPDLRYQNALDFKTDINNLIQDPEYFLQDGYLYFDASVDADLIDYENYSNRPADSALKKGLVVFLACLTSFVLVSASVLIYTGKIAEVFKFVSYEEVPNFNGKTLAEVEEYCSKNSIKLTVIETHDNNYEPGVVISQNPKAKSELEKFNALEITINKYASPFKLPNYTGLSYKDVQAELVEKGYKVNIVYEIDELGEGLILRQSPKEGVSVDGNDVITLYVCSYDNKDSETEESKTDKKSEEDEKNDESNDDKSDDETENTEIIEKEDSDKSNDENKEASHDNDVADDNGSQESESNQTTISDENKTKSPESNEEDNGEESDE